MTWMLGFFFLSVVGLMAIVTALGVIEAMANKTKWPVFEDATMTRFSKNVMVIEFKGRGR